MEDSFDKKELVKRTREELEKILTEKEKAFCWRYVVLRNGAKAAREAGYSENTAKETAYENLTKPHIVEYLDVIKECLEEATGVNKFRQLEELSKLAYSGIENLHNTWIELNDWEIIKDQNPNALAAIESIDTKIETKTIKVNEDTDIDIETKYVKIKLYSKIAAIAEINKMMGYNAAEKHDLRGKDGKELGSPIIVFRKYKNDEPE